jgi:hypothetical protein
LPAEHEPALACVVDAAIHAPAILFDAKQRGPRATSRSSKRSTFAHSIAGTFVNEQRAREGSRVDDRARGNAWRSTVDASGTDQEPKPPGTPLLA